MVNRFLKPFFLGILSGIFLSGILVIVIFSPAHEFGRQILIKSSSTPIVTLNNDQISENLGKIDINLADQKELETLPGIGEAKARAIVEYRNKYGNFETLTELLYVPGISTTLLQSITDRITIR